MVHFYATLLLTIVLLALAILYWRSGLGSANHSPSKPEYYLLAYGIIAVLAMLVPTPVSIAYKAAILFGVILALLAMAAQRTLKAPPVVVHAIDLVVALLYMVTFLAHHPLKWPTPWLLLPLFIAGGLYLFLRPRLAELHSTLLVYGVILWLLIWQAIELLTVAPGLWTWSAVAGVVGFVLVKAAVATNFLTGQPAASRRVAADRTASSTPSRGHRLLRSAESATQRWAGKLRLAAGAQKLVVVAPLLILLYQWLLVLSIWGPSLTEYVGAIGQLP